MKLWQGTVPVLPTANNSARELRTHPSGAAIPRIPALDGLRGCAAILVIATHSIFAATSDRVMLLDRAFNVGLRVIGPSGVDLFFVLSGYLITCILDRTRNTRHPFSFFYARRVLRIVPLYFAYLLLIPIVFESAGPIATGTGEMRSWDWLFLTNLLMTKFSPDEIGFLFGHLWSLAIEEQFYIVWPLVILLVPVRHLPRVCIALIGCSFLGRVAFTAAGNAHYGWLLMPTRLDGMAAGALVALAQARAPERLDAISKKLLVPAGAAAAVLFLVLIAGLWSYDGPLFNTFETGLAVRKVEILLAPLVGAGLFAICVARVASATSGGPRWLTTGWLRLVGRSSYGTYLFHLPIATLMIGMGVPRMAPVGGFDLPYQLVFALSLLVISTAFGTLTWHLYEKQWLRLAPAYRKVTPVIPAP